MEDSNFFSFQSPAVHWIARTSSLNWLSCKNPYQTPHSLNALPPFHWQKKHFPLKNASSATLPQDRLQVFTCNGNIGVCVMATKFLDNKICTFKILLSWRFPRKKLGADFWEVDLDSNFSIFGVRRLTEWPGPLHWIAFRVEILTKPPFHWIPPPFSLKSLFLHVKVLRRIPCPKSAPKKQRFGQVSLSTPKAAPPPLKTANFIFIVVSPSLRI